MNTSCTRIHWDSSGIGKWCANYLIYSIHFKEFFKYYIFSRVRKCTKSNANFSLTSSHVNSATHAIVSELYSDFSFSICSFNICECCERSKMLFMFFLIQINNMLCLKLIIFFCKYSSNKYTFTWLHTAQLTILNFNHSHWES